MKDCSGPIRLSGVISQLKVVALVFIITDCLGGRLGESGTASGTALATGEGVCRRTNKAWCLTAIPLKVLLMSCQSFRDKQSFYMW